MLPKQNLATIYTESYTYYIHTDKTWGRFKTYRACAKAMKIKNGSARVFWSNNMLTPVNLDSLDDAFTYVDADPHAQPEFDLKNLKAWCDYVMG